MVMEFGTNREPVYDFILVINGNLSRTVTEIQRLISQNHKFCPPSSYLAPLFGLTPFEFIEKLYGS